MPICALTFINPLFFPRIMTLDLLAEKLQKQHFRIAVVQGVPPCFPDVSASLRASGYAVGDVPRPYLPASFYEPAFAQHTPRVRKAALAQALAPYAHAILREKPDACVVNYQSPSDEGEALAAMFHVLSSQYKKTSSIVIPFIHLDEAAVLSAVRVAHGISFYCSDLAFFLNALDSLYPSQQEEPASLFKESVRILTDATFSEQRKYEQLRPRLLALSLALDDPQFTSKFISASETIADFRLRVHGLYSILYERPLAVPGAIYA